jgi:opacity protein-like surface antigen
MTSSTTLATMLAAIAVSALPALAQEPRAAQATPFVAVGTAGAAPVGVAVSVPLTTSLSAETELGYAPGADQVHALTTSVSLIQNLPRLGRVTPYLAAGVGLAQYGAPVLGLDGPPLGTEKRLAFTVNAGGGLTLPVNSHLDLRTDARYFDSLGQGADEFRIAQGISFDLGKRRK